MQSFSHWRLSLTGALCAACFIAPAGAATLLDTGTPDGGFLGYYGFDVSAAQSVAIAFTPDQSYSFDSAGLWMMSNDFDAAGGQFTVSLQSGSSTLGPSGTTLESWAVVSSAVGWNPVLETVSSVLHPVLTAGTTYWIVAQSSATPGLDPVWVSSGNSAPYTMGNIDFTASPAWQVGVTSGPPGAIVNATLLPVPEPATWALALLGMPLVVRLARRRRAETAAA